MAIPINYRGQGQPLVNYTFTDIAAGTGIISFYGGHSSGALSGTEFSSYLLSNNAFWSNQIASTNTTTNGTPTLTQSLNFDVVLQKPITIASGSLIVNIPNAVGQAGGSSGVGRLSVVLKKVVGGTESAIGAASGAAHLSAAGSTTYFMDAIKINTPVTTVNVGETLRLLVETYGNTNGGGTVTNFIGHDPKNRATANGSPGSFGTSPSNLIMFLPIRIDL